MKRIAALTLCATFMAAGASLLGAATAFAQAAAENAAPPGAPSSSPMTAVPTTKILAIGSRTQPPDVIRKILPEEVRETVKLYLAGKIDQWYVKQDQSGVVFMVNVTSTEEAARLLEALPLGRAHAMTFQYVPLGPLSPLRQLLTTP